MSKTLLNHYDFSILAGSAIRYALGRKTYIVQATCDIVLNHIDDLQVPVKEVIIRDIKKAIADNEAGMDCDITCWRKFLYALENK